MNCGPVYPDFCDLDKAIENFKRTIALSPQGGKACHGLGSAYARLGRSDEAVGAFAICRDKS